MGTGPRHLCLALPGVGGRVPRASSWGSSPVLHIQACGADVPSRLVLLLPAHLHDGFAKCVCPRRAQLHGLLARPLPLSALGGCQGGEQGSDRGRCRLYCFRLPAQAPCEVQSGSPTRSPALTVVGFRGLRAYSPSEM